MSNVHESRPEVTRATPGPWKITHDEHFQVTWIEREGPAADETAICEVVRYQQPQYRANAALIAAAPELADGYSTILERLATEPMQDDELADFCRAALAKAGLR